MLSFITWYLTITLIGAAAFPIGYRFFPFLRDRGYAVSRALGLLLWGYIFWLLGSLHVINNNMGGQVVALLIFFGLAAWSGKGKWGDIKRWISNQTKTILVVEIVFLLLFAGWAVVRSANPNITGTEKPMELAFISSLLKSPTFPPNDPWLSGYAISYYYFGYVFVSMLIRITGVGIGIGFNLASALWFALTGIAAYGVLYNLVNANRSNEPLTVENQPGVFKPILAPIFVLIVSNIEGFFEVLHSKGLFWNRLADGTFQSKFWAWLKLEELNVPPTEPFTWIPERLGGILWWRASRVIQDYRLSDIPSAAVNPKGPIEIIDEFPFFSYLLADLHPHVLVMPFAFLAISLALNIYLGGAWRFDAVNLGWLKKKEFWFSGIILGGLGFLNLWDFPIYVGLFSLAYTLVRTINMGWSRARIIEFIKCGLAFGITGFILYLPFYLGFDSQAGGIMPSLLFFTRGINFWIMFMPLLVPIFLWLVGLSGDKNHRKNWITGAKIAAAVIGGLWALMLLLGLVAINLPNIGQAILNSNNQSTLGVNLVGWGNAFWELQGGALVDAVRVSPGILIAQSIIRRLISPGAWITLAVLLLLVCALLAKMTRDGQVDRGELQDRSVGPAGFVVLLVLLGAGLTLVPEFFYLRDQFATRMNTIFKFYFQTWLLWAIAAGYASVELFSTPAKRFKPILVGIWVVVFAMSLFYPLQMLPERMSEGGLKSSEWTLDGTRYISQYNPDEAAAIEWLRKAPVGTIAEAVGGAYSGYGRISVHSGQPTVIGWVNHESQWRGGYEEIGSRPDDIRVLYTSNTWVETDQILQKYHIRYVVVSDVERGAYSDSGFSELKFQKYLITVFNSGSVTIYEVPGWRAAPRLK